MGRLLEKCPVLKDLLESRTARSQSGKLVPMHSNIPPGLAETLYETVRQENPAVVLEVGMAFGVSSLAILSALRDGTQNGRLISIDPFQSSSWKGCGRTAIAQAGLSDRHELVEEYDYHALPRLLATGLKLDFAYIDGWHTFDYTLLDWWYVDKMLAVNGIVTFNDCSFRAVKKVIRFVLTHRKYFEIDAEGSGALDGERSTEGFLRRLASGRNKLWKASTEDRYFRKTENWEPAWDFFARF